MRDDFCKDLIYIVRLLKVIRAGNPKHHKLLQVNGRYSDAFVYVLSGSCTYTFDSGSQCTVCAGDILYLAYNANYSMFIHDENYRYIYCDFEFAAPHHRSSGAVTPKDSSHTEHLFIRLLNAYQSSAFADSMSVLYSIYGEVLSLARGSYLNSTLKQRLANAKEHIDAHLDDDTLSVAALARSAGMSEVYFRTCFKAQYGRTPAQYRMAARLNRAKELMQYSFLSLEECAHQSGFSSLQYFCRSFKKELGITPAQYRKGL